MANTTTTALAWLAVLAPACGGAAALATVARRPGGADATWPARVGSVAALVVALAVAAATAVAGATVSPTVGAGGLGASVRLDAVSVVMLAMITVLGWVIIRYSATYLDGDPRQPQFLAGVVATLAAVELLVIAGNLVLLVAAWVATSLALHQLLVFHRHRPRAVAAARKKFVLARIGDAFLVAAAVALWSAFGTGDLDTIFRGAAEGGAATTAAAVCLVVAAMLKSAQFPGHGWLVEVMETPTPVSALLHAGILNGGPFLVVRMAYVVDGRLPATLPLIIVGALTASFASVALLTQPTVKAALGYSSAAHMGFMLLLCGAGLYPAALLHLVAHSFYKAHAFLSSGSVMDEARAGRIRHAARLGRPGRIAASAAVATAVYLVAARLAGTAFDDPVLVAVGGVLVLGLAVLLAAAIDTPSSGAVVAAVTVLAGAVAVAFVTLEAGTHALLGPTVPEPHPQHAATVAAVCVALAGFAAIVVALLLEPRRPSTARRRALALHLRNGLYASAVFDRLVGSLRIPPAPAPAGAHPMGPRATTPDLATATTPTGAPSWS